MNSIAIVTVGYNRPDSMKLLIRSLLDADYLEQSVDLIVSIDKGARQDEIIAVAEQTTWPFGKRHIRAFSERQGLRKHIIQCGDLTQTYDAVIVLEDDLLVSRFFFSYVKQALDYYRENEKIAGISLYKHETHPGVLRPFEPANNGYDVFWMQYAMSWGQCWTKKMWGQFKEWYLKNETADLWSDNALPAYIQKWNKQSWLKYYMKYIVETNKYFVYPYFSLTTNSSDMGEHCRIPNNDFQVALSEGDRRYFFPEDNNVIKYDVFFERMDIENLIMPTLSGTKVLDLYGIRKDFHGARYAISTQRLPYKIIKQLQLKYRPIEMNCIMPKEGNGIFVYDLSTIDKCPPSNTNLLTRYDVRGINWRKLLKLGFGEFIDALFRKIGK